MKIDELESRLHTSRANVDYYEQQGLWTSQDGKMRTDREYSTSDVERLRTVLLLRKLGIPVERLRAFFDGETDFRSLLETRLSEFPQPQETAAGKACAELLARGCDVCSLEELESVVVGLEQSGERFAEVEKDWMAPEQSMMRCLRWMAFGLGSEDEKKPWWKQALWVLFFCTVSGCVKRWVWKSSFWEGFCYPLILFLGVSLLIIPITLLRLRFPRAARWYTGIVAGVAIGALLLIIVALIAAAFL